MTESIPIRVRAPDDGTLSKGLLDRATDSVLAQVDLAVLKNNLAELRKSIAELMDAEEESTGYRLQAIEVGVEVSAEGGLNIIGSLTAAGKAGIKLTFQRG